VRDSGILGQGHGAAFRIGGFAAHGLPVTVKGGLGLQEQLSEFRFTENPPGWDAFAGRLNRGNPGLHRGQIALKACDGLAVCGLHPAPGIALMGC
jgi:hypothetical protein